MQNKQEKPSTCSIQGFCWEQTKILAAVLPLCKPATKLWIFSNHFNLNMHVCIVTIPCTRVLTIITCPEDLEWESCLLATGSSKLVPKASATALFLVPPSVLTFLRGNMWNIFEENILLWNQPLSAVQWRAFGGTPSGPSAASPSTPQSGPSASAAFHLDLRPCASRRQSCRWCCLGALCQQAPCGQRRVNYWGGW